MAEDISSPSSSVGSNSSTSCSDSNMTTASPEPSPNSTEDKTSRPRGQKTGRRKYTNRRERWRQHNVNVAFVELRKILPTYPVEKKLCKNEILRLAVRYIKFLETLLQDLDKCYAQERCENCANPQQYIKTEAREYYTNTGEHGAFMTRTFHHINVYHHKDYLSAQQQRLAPSCW